MKNSNIFQGFEEVFVYLKEVFEKIKYGRIKRTKTAKGEILRKVGSG